MRAAWYRDPMSKISFILGGAILSEYICRLVERAKRIRTMVSCYIEGDITSLRDILRDIIPP